jgi:hypothetical protein
MRSKGLFAASRRGGRMAVWPVLMLLAHPAVAQMAAPPNLNNFQGFNPSGVPNFGQAAPAAPTAARPPPVGLPGAQPKGAPAPPTQPPALMSPTDAMFDAINRGDLAAAQDALGRGADLNGHDVLGMTPVQLSIDLGRNDITFLLLSAGGGAATPSQATAAALAAQSGTKGVGSGKLARSAERRSTRLVRANTVAAPAPIQTPRLFAGNGGSPIPSAGFLGFDPGR